MTIGLRAPVYGLVYGYGKPVYIPPEPEPETQPQASGGGIVGVGGVMVPGQRYEPIKFPRQHNLTALQEDRDFLVLLEMLFNGRRDH